MIDEGGHLVFGEERRLPSLLLKVPFDFPQASPRPFPLLGALLNPSLRRAHSDPRITKDSCGLGLFCPLWGAHGPASIIVRPTRP